LLHDRSHAEPAGERIHDVDLEADQLARIRRIFIDIRLAALYVRAPGQLASRADLSQRVAVTTRLVMACDQTRDERDRDTQTHPPSMQ
jgi:hypothetical protein